MVLGVELLQGKHFTDGVISQAPPPSSLPLREIAHLMAA